jgi:hypothetical protein
LCDEARIPDRLPACLPDLELAAISAECAAAAGCEALEVAAWPAVCDRQFTGVRTLFDRHRLCQLSAKVGRRSPVCVQLTPLLVI